MINIFKKRVKIWGFIKYELLRKRGGGFYFRIGREMVVFCYSLVSRLVILLFFKYKKVIKGLEGFLFVIVF